MSAEQWSEPVSDSTTAVRTNSSLRAVICGTFRRDLDSLKLDYAVLAERFTILSPLSLDFVDTSAEFVRLEHESADDQTDIEQGHLDALVEADFVWLHAPEGYVGPSAMFELGHAKALGIPIFSSCPLQESTFQPWVSVVAGPSAVEVVQDLMTPGNGLRGLQRYYERAADRRGWATETVQDTMLLMTEEIGELARAIRKAAGLNRDHEWEGQDVAEELADVQLYLVHLANATGVDLGEAVTAKESVNAERVARRVTIA